MSPRREGPIAGSGVDAAQRAGITLRQLEHWIARQYIAPIRHGSAHPGIGQSRSFTGADIEALAVLGRLMVVRDSASDGVAERIREIVRHVQAHGATGTFDLIPGVTVDLEVLLADDRERETA